MAHVCMRVWCTPIAVAVAITRRITSQMGSQYEMNGVKHEIAVLKKLRHPNIVPLYEVIDDPGRNKLYLILEYVPGGVLCRSGES